MPKILLHTGPSERGWHRLQLVKECEQKYAFDKLLNLPTGDRAPLLKGGVGHAGLAHFYAQLQARQLGTDPTAFYDPLEAMQLVAAKDQLPNEVVKADELQQVYDSVAHYADRYRGEELRILLVEQAVETAVSGHRYTARLDLVVEDKAGRVWIVDHKFHGRIDARSKMRYTLSGQFLGFQWLGPQFWGERWGGVRINLVGLTDGKFERLSPEPAPGMLARFPQIVADGEERIAQLAASGRSPWNYPRAASEQVCVTAYGKCPFYGVCQWEG